MNEFPVANRGRYWSKPYIPSGPSVPITFLLPYLWDKEVREVRRRPDRFTSVLVSKLTLKSCYWELYVGTRVECDAERSRIGEGVIYQLANRKDKPMNKVTRAQRGYMILSSMEELYGNGEPRDNVLDTLTDILHTGLLQPNELITALNTAINHHAEEQANDPS